MQNPRFALYPTAEAPALYPDIAGLSRVLKAISESGEPATRPRSNYDRLPGRYTPTFDVVGVESLLELNTHHSICLQRCSHAIVGQGHESTKIYDVLDPLSPEGSWQQVLGEIGDDLAEKHCTFLEVVREPRGDPKGAIRALYPIPVRFLTVEVEDYSGNRSFLVVTEAGTERRFACFGDLERVNEASKAPIGEESSITEILPIRLPNNRSSWFGHPSWLSAVPWIELGALAVQRKFDFYFNRGVPEFLLFLQSSVGLDDKTWKALENVFKSFAGVGNQYKSGAFEISDIDAKITPVKLASDLAADSTEFASVFEMIDAHIVSAHGMPPLLASIMTPGKLGGANEGPNAVRIYQILRIDPIQMALSRTLGRTLGNPQYNGGLGLTLEDFLPKAEEQQESMQKTQQELQRAQATGEAPNPQNMRSYHTGFHTIIDRLNFGFSPDVSAQMRQDEGEARAQGRDPKKGLIRE